LVSTAFDTISFSRTADSQLYNARLSFAAAWKTGYAKRASQALDLIGQSDRSSWTRGGFATVQDSFGAISNNTVGWGHVTSYYAASADLGKTIRAAQAKEFFANYFQLRAMNDTVGVATLRRFCPNMTSWCDDAFERIGSRRKR